MKKILKLLSGIAFSVISGCYSDQTPLTVVDAWEKSGADKLEIKKALLECGTQTFSDLSSEKGLSIREKLNAHASVDACMLQAGFRNKFEEPRWCEREKYKVYNLSICRPGAVIPQRSVEIRLNSPYCKENKDQPECQP
ncbi:hypothetical protein [Bartonella taylorii]|uniref:Lipoprotein n=1 Tax=Bartonella taylorii TaxID=33046 RepID=A0A9Q8YY94_BARTA|nr:hypothetical protein [Bartonella taylorii]OPB33920.1 hypothetical protein Btaycd_013050 [Bartonella taylorii]USP03314.1 hypothetical protein LAJ60_02440 [Bartonella taylorii]